MVECILFSVKFVTEALASQLRESGYKCSVEDEGHKLHHTATDLFRACAALL